MFSSLIPYLALLLPVALPIFGSTVASLLSQDGFPAWLNDLLAWFAMLIAAIASAFLTGAFAGGDIPVIVGAIAGIITLLVNGELYKLRPYLVYLDFLQSLSVVKPSPIVLTTPARPIASNAYIPPDARQQIAALPTIRRPALSPTTDYQTAPMPAVNPQATQFVQPPAWLHPNEATGMTEVPLQTTPPTAMHWGDSQTMPAVQPPAWIHPSEATAPTEMPIHFGDTGVIPTV